MRVAVSKAFDSDLSRQASQAIPLSVEIYEQSIISMLSVKAWENLIHGNVEVIHCSAGMRIPRDSRPRFLDVVARGQVSLLSDGSGQIVGQVTLGRSLELSTLLAKEEKWKYLWQAESDCTLLRIGWTAFCMALHNENPGVLHYLNKITLNTELQKLKNDLKLFGFTKEEIITTFTLLNISTDFTDLTKLWNCLGVLHQGELSFRTFKGDESTLLGYFNRGSYFHLDLELFDELSCEQIDNPTLWLLPKQSWLDKVSREKVEGFLNFSTLRRAPFRKEQSDFNKLHEPSPPPDLDPCELAEFELDKSCQQTKLPRRLVGVLQQEEMDCAAACLSTVARFYGKSLQLERLRALLHVGQEGSSLQDIKAAAQQIGFKSVGIFSRVVGLKNIQMPVIALMKYHFVVIFRISETSVLLFDPSEGVGEQPLSDFGHQFSGYALCLKPKASFEKIQESGMGLKKYSVLFKQLRLPVLLGISALILSIGIAGALPFLIGFTFDHLPYGSISRDWASFLGIIMLVFGSKVLIDRLQQRLFQEAVYRLDLMGSALLMRHFCGLPIGYILARKVGDITDRFAAVTNIRNQISKQGTFLLSSILGVIIYSSIIGYYSTSHLCVVLVGLLGLLVYITFLSPVLIQTFSKLQRSCGDFAGLIFELVNNADVIQAIHGQIPARWRAECGLRRELAHQQSYEILNGQVRAVGILLQWSLMGCILVCTVLLLRSSNLTIGQSIALTWMSLQILSATMQFMLHWRALGEIARSSFLIDSMVTTPKERLGIHSPIDELKGLVQIKGVEFRYGNERHPMTLQDIELVIRKGDKVAFIGNSGSGKTTLAKLLNGFYRPSKGQVLIDGIEVGSYLQEDLRKQVSLVSNESVFIPGSVLENICLGDPCPQFERAVFAAKSAMAHEFISRLKGGYSAQLTPGFVNLSTGEKQRLILARAFYIDPKILILDEITSALDAGTENRIFKNLLSRPHTTIVITHRLQMTPKFDGVVVLDEGRICEVGTHAELMAKQGHYYEMFQRQMMA